MRKNRINTFTSQSGITLVELLVSFVVLGLVSSIAFNFLQGMSFLSTNQKEKVHLDGDLNEAVKTINLFLRQCGTGTGEDAFSDPQGLIASAAVTRRRNVFDTSETNRLEFFGNFSGETAQMEIPIINATDTILVSNPTIFATGQNILINAYPNQEVALVTEISGRKLTVSNTITFRFPKGTLVCPFDRVEITSTGDVINVSRYKSTGSLVWRGRYGDRNRSGDSAIFAVTSYNPNQKILNYSLAITSQNNSTGNVQYIRNMAQSILLRGI